MKMLIAVIETYCYNFKTYVRSGKKKLIRIGKEESSATLARVQLVEFFGQVEILFENRKKSTIEPMWNDSWYSSIANCASSTRTALVEQHPAIHILLFVCVCLNLGSCTKMGIRNFTQLFHLVGSVQSSLGVGLIVLS